MGHIKYEDSNCFIFLGKVFGGALEGSFSEFSTLLAGFCRILKTFWVEIWIEIYFRGVGGKS